MASKERILRLKEETRTKILTAALQIVKEEGWQALSLRKIAEVIEYTAPIIYEYFTNKEAILLELTRQGYTLLYERIKLAKSKHRLPALQLEAMWMAYWNFAFAEKEYYQIMYGVEMNCCAMQNTIAEEEWPGTLFGEVILELTKHKKPTDDDLCRWYYTFWSVVHGLVSINIVRIGSTTDEINKQILKSAITGMIRSITD
jgi:AcrR family transcriptional regulator